MAFDDSPAGIALSDALTGCLNFVSIEALPGYIFQPAAACLDQQDGRGIRIQEKPLKPRSRFAVPGLYFYGPEVVDIAERLRPSRRGEYEITDVNKVYLQQGRLKVGILDKGTAWLDTGTFVSLMQASQFVQVIEERQGQKIGCIEEVAYRMGFINAEQLKKAAEPLVKSGYGKYLLGLTG